MTVAIITARSGSKGLPHKNIRELGGIPLLGWTIKALSKSKLVNNTILSTDSDEYFKIGSQFNNKLIYHKRPPPLAEDVPSEFVILDAIKTLNEYFEKESLITLVQPTTPFLTHEDIDSCINKMIKNPSMNSCVTVKSVSEYPEWQFTKKGGNTDICISGNLSGEISVRQNLKKRWIPNGGAYIMRKAFLERTKKVIDDQGILIHEMSKLQSMDIDDLEDFNICEALVKSNFVSCD
jgi:CMP-N,N'-diacetyllegionaminic acid synthase